MKTKFVYFLIVILISFPLPAFAQTQTPCDSAAPLQSLGEFIKALTSNDAASALQMAGDAQRAIGEFEASCSGLKWAGHGDAILGPMLIPNGVYRATLTTSNGTVSTNITVLSGECRFPLLFADHTENFGVADLTDCNAIIEVHGYSFDWTLTLGLLATR